MNRVAIVGNGGGGKTTLARKVAQALDLPLSHVDSIQFQPGWKRTPQAECDAKLDALAGEERWVIDGFGSLAVMSRRFAAADTVIFVDFPLWRHYWWALKRQVRHFRDQRTELPPGCPEGSLGFCRKLAQVMWRVHREIRPWFVEQLNALPATTRVVHLRSPREWRVFARQIEAAGSGEDPRKGAGSMGMRDPSDRRPAGPGMEEGTSSKPG